VQETLAYTARLRCPPDYTPDQREEVRGGGRAAGRGRGAGLGCRAAASVGESALRWAPPASNAQAGLPGSSAPAAAAVQPTLLCPACPAAHPRGAGASGADARAQRHCRLCPAQRWGSPRRGGGGGLAGRWWWRRPPSVRKWGGLASDGVGVHQGALSPPSRLPHTPPPAPAPAPQASAAASASACASPWSC
jgi:hypothetical protein